MPPADALPPRLERPGPLAFALAVGVGALIVSSFVGAQVSPARFLEGLPRMAEMIGRMLPPDVTRLEPVAWRLVETLQMAVAGTVIGVVLSLPLAVLATRRHTPAGWVRWLARGIVALFRTVPDLVWALLFVVAVGLGPFAGTLALVVDTIGFCARFFAEAMEEVDPGPEEALTALGAPPVAVVACAVLPAALPAMIASSLYALERAVRSSVVLGLVGAGGIGIELKVAIDMFAYDQAVTIILGIFLLVLVVERAGAAARGRIITGAAA
jgi:phosphonate transport system permease protein